MGTALSASILVGRKWLVGTEGTLVLEERDVAHALVRPHARRQYKIQNRHSSTPAQRCATTSAPQRPPRPNMSTTGAWQPTREESASKASTESQHSANHLCWNVGSCFRFRNAARWDRTWSSHIDVMRSCHARNSNRSCSWKPQ